VRQVRGEIRRIGRVDDDIEPSNQQAGEETGSYERDEKAESLPVDE
jgi:hypothetical protein